MYLWHLHPQFTFDQVCIPYCTTFILLVHRAVGRSGRIHGMREKRISADATPNSEMGYLRVNMGRTTEYTELLPWSQTV